MSPLSITKLGLKTKNWLINSMTVDIYCFSHQTFMMKQYDQSKGPVIGY